MINVKILDACCGSKMFWFNKNEPHTTYMDNRSDCNEYRDRDYIRSVIVNIIGIDKFWDRYSKPITGKKVPDDQ